MNNKSYLEKLDCIPSFESKVTNKDFCKTNKSLTTMQINIGKLCNLACKHCHVEAGPSRTEIMNLETMKDCLQVFKENNFSILDITGGAPEMNPNFEWLVKEAIKIGAKVIVRSNLVILREEKYKHLLEFYAENKVEVVCSLPYYSAKDADRQRGEGVFNESINILKKLNKLGYGKDESLVLNLVYNPGGAFLPPPQECLELEYKQKLKKEYEITFNNLFTITNNPVGRFGAFLKRSNNLEGYMERLSNNFNSSTVENMMCRNQLSIAWDGKLYDCDFNQTLGWTVNGKNHISMLKGNPIEKRQISLGNHCYACTAGSGSSCGGSTT
ncbi:radical SAM/Cys-rich domain protein [Clostridium sporogenes]|uniref:arsenosugar biosynthesis radical SAM (seleno)protein ArsS n=1 Tax=Clostridium sporogenes TaxID=1509 RepID=UPI0013D16D4D|nr:arsenosugar biosynthesis radical SAM (seleno)protein ArsS [Clostridium sporogenes]EJE7235525.1 arsenosugar biosynthesis radical SAM protein ArsS [Clostridium botulinum]EJE7236944.1 arsenosugar biosynthesis radical SAM protein ArsS [Clostridium botulinum]NFE79840.1 radical SAM/Cys-rich domain protein [Clostridium sporogenes]NFG70347.1 radical SAM/Cys-rich domain protein [Clostridium sporogenes]